MKADLDHVLMPLGTDAARQIHGRDFTQRDRR
jgi:hypothetical protein